ncbi:unnamed protein product [Chrysoparadoxa australica]
MSDGNVDGASSAVPSVLVTTATNSKSGAAQARELSLLLGDSSYDLHSVCDPEGVRVGSGGGTLNALLQVEETLNMGGRSMAETRTIMIHSGGDSQRCPLQSVCGKAWSTLPNETLSTPLELLLTNLEGIFKLHPLAPGSLVVAACDVLTLLPMPALIGDGKPWDWGSDQITGVAMAEDKSLVVNFGVYVSNGGSGISTVERYLQKPTVEEAERDGAVFEGQAHIDTGIVVFGPLAASKLLKLAQSCSFNGCCSHGAIEGIPPLRLELYSDLLLACRMGHGDGTLQTYLTQAAGGKKEVELPLSQARTELWETFHDCALKAVCLKGGRFAHLGTSDELLQMVTLQLPAFATQYGMKRICGSVSEGCQVDEMATVVNSRLSGGYVGHLAVVEHSQLSEQGWSVGEGAYLSGIRRTPAALLKIRPHMCVQEVQYDTSSFVISLCAMEDNIKAHYTSPRAGWCGVPWDELLKLLNLTLDDVWPGVPEPERTLWEAKLFPLLASEIPHDAKAVFWPMMPEGIEKDGAICMWKERERLSYRDILALCDPVGEFSWRRGMKEKYSEERRRGREKVRGEVATARKLVKPGSCSPLQIGHAVRCQCPVRIDLAGGWSDTPPICYENDRGGSVTTLAVLVDGKWPIEAQAVRLQEQHLLLCTEASGVEVSSVRVASHADMEGFSDPSSPCCLLKACAVYLGLVSVDPGTDPPEQQLLRTMGGAGGLSVTSNSALPMGSGMGVSSILAGAVLDVMARAMGRPLDSSSLIHAVLQVEQLMTTGGGWQDQAGGLMGGATITRCKQGLPLQVHTERLPISDWFEDLLHERLVLIYTGRARLAKGLLETVLQTWESRGSRVTLCLESLVSLSEKAAQAVRRSDDVLLGRVLDESWRLKKAMVDGAEPLHVSALCAALRPLCLGMSLNGAGGGGFATCLLRQGVDLAAVKRRLEECKVTTRGVTAHAVLIATVGPQRECN